jgi:hypothetical protein
LQDEESSEETEVGIDDKQEEPEAVSLSECDASTPSDLSEDQIYVGVVDRVTGGANGNAIVGISDDGGEINLGPIDGSAEGEEVRFTFEGGIWGRCLEDKYTYKSYSPRDGATRPKRRNKKSPNPYRSGGKPRKSDPDNLNKLLTGHQ